MKRLELQGAGGWRVTVLPERGGAIESIVHPSGLELLAQGLRTPPASADYAAGGLGGYDDCFPSIAASDVSGDHGNLWHRAWSVIDDADGRLVLRCALDEAVVEREIRLDADGVDLHVRIRSRSEAPLAFIWSGHLLLAVDDDTELELANPVVIPEFNNRELAEGTPIDLDSVWPSRSGRRRWSALIEGTFVKSFQRAGSGWPVLHRQGVRIAVDSSAPWTGLWFNRGGFPSRGQYQHIGVEPCTSPHDALADAVRSGTAQTLARDEEFEVRIRIRAIVHDLG
jgi:galactose mutarotase-like enzyme